MRTHDVHLPADTPAAELAILQAAEQNDESSREPLRALLARNPELVERLGTVAADTEDAILAVGTCQVLTRETARAEVAALRHALARPGDADLERLLIDRIGLCWMALLIADMTRAARWADGVSTESADFWDRHVSRLNGDFLRACKTLAMVRRALVPGVQVNIAEKQVNVGG